MCAPRRPCQNHYQGRCWADATAECERCGAEVEPSTGLVPPPIVLCADCACCDYCGELCPAADIGDLDGDRGCQACRARRAA